MQESTYCVCDPWMKHATEQKVYHWHTHTITHNTLNRTKFTIVMCQQPSTTRDRTNVHRHHVPAVAHKTHKSQLNITHLPLLSTRHTNHNSTLLTSPSSPQDTQITTQHYSPSPLHTLILVPCSDLIEARDELVECLAVYHETRHTLLFVSDDVGRTQIVTVNSPAK